MYSLELDMAEFKKLNFEARDLLSSVFSGIAPKSEAMTIPAQHTLFGGFEEHDSFFILRDGNLKNESRGRLLFIYEEGDLIGFEKTLVPAESKLMTDFAIIVDEYDKKTVLDELAGDREKLEKWHKYLALQFNLFSLMLAHLMRDTAVYVPTIRNYEPGDVIIKENTEASEVYSMLDGRANAFVDGIKVGEIKPDELFGAIAALTGTTRTASVIADTFCTVIVSTRSGFKKMLESNPNTVDKLVEDMARVIVSTNTKIVEMSKK